eukprot:jgi/Bigna1/74470/fgenesh1_pg.29_\
MSAPSHPLQGENKEKPDVVLNLGNYTEGESSNENAKTMEVELKSGMHVDMTPTAEVVAQAVVSSKIVEASTSKRKRRRGRPFRRETGAAKAEKKKKKKKSYNGLMRREIWRPEAYLSWSEDRQQRWDKIPIDPNSSLLYMLDNAEVSNQTWGNWDKVNTSQWTKNEIRSFKYLIKTHPIKGPKWGLFSMNILGRTGYQCEQLAKALKKKTHHPLLAGKRVVPANPLGSAGKKKKTTKNPKSKPTVAATSYGGSEAKTVLGVHENKENVLGNTQFPSAHNSPAASPAGSSAKRKSSMTPAAAKTTAQTLAALGTPSLPSKNLSKMNPTPLSTAKKKKKNKNKNKKNRHLTAAAAAPFASPSTDAIISTPVQDKDGTSSRNRKADAVVGIAHGGGTVLINPVVAAAAARIHNETKTGGKGDAAASGAAAKNALADFMPKKLFLSNEGGGHKKDGHLAASKEVAEHDLINGGDGSMDDDDDDNDEHLPVSTVAREKKSERIGKGRQRGVAVKGGERKRTHETKTSRKNKSKKKQQQQQQQQQHSFSKPFPPPDPVHTPVQSLFSKHHNAASLHLKAKKINAATPYFSDIPLEVLSTGVHSEKLRLKRMYEMRLRRLETFWSAQFRHHGAKMTNDDKAAARREMKSEKRAIEVEYKISLAAVATGGGKFIAHA